MKPLYEFPAVDEVYEEASIWIARMDKGLTADDEDALRKWLSQSNDNRAVFLEMTKLWDRMDTLSRLSDIFPHAPAQERQPLRLPLGLAASLVVAVVVYGWVPSYIRLPIPCRQSLRLRRICTKPLSVLSLIHISEPTRPY